MARTRSLADQFERIIKRVLTEEVPDIIVTEKMRPLATTMWAQLLRRTARDTGRLQHFWTGLVTRQNAAMAEVPNEVFTSAKIRKPGHYPRGNTMSGAAFAQQIKSPRDKFVIASGIPYVEYVEGTKPTWNHEFHTKPRMAQNTVEFLVRNARSIMR